MPETFKISEDFDLVHLPEKNEWELIDNKGNMKVIMNEEDFNGLHKFFLSNSWLECPICKLTVHLTEKEIKRLKNFV